MLSNLLLADIGFAFSGSCDVNFEVYGETLLVVTGQFVTLCRQARHSSPWNLVFVHFS